MRCTVFLLAAFMLIGVQGSILPPPNQKFNELPILTKVFEFKEQLGRALKGVLHLDTLEKPSKTNSSNIVEKNITQKLDHFDQHNNETWQMRYFVDDTVYRPGNPIFIYLGGEWTAYPEGLYGDQISAYAEKYHGLLLTTEHRFYGKSLPKPDLELETLEKYLNVEQALADLAHFIRTMKKTYPGAEKSKVILVGASYSAALASYFAKLYPELTDGAWASSAPILAKPNFFEKLEIVGQNLKKHGGQECYDRIQKAFKAASEIFKKGNATEYHKMAKVCPFNDTEGLDVSNAFYYFSDNIATNMQNADDTTIPEICKHFVNDKEDHINFAKYFELRYFGENATEDQCMDLSFKGAVDSRVTNYFENSKQWTFQTCNEFGWFPTSESPNQPFGSDFPLAYFAKLCQAIFGEKFTAEYMQKHADYINNKFGGLHPVKNVYYTQGSLDPWRGAGIGYIIEGSSHAVDLFRPNATLDSPQMTEAYKKVDKVVKGWIKAKK